MKKELAEWIWYFFLDVEAKAVAEKTAAAAQTKTEKFQKMKKRLCIISRLRHTAGILRKKLRVKQNR